MELLKQVWEAQGNRGGGYLPNRDISDDQKRVLIGMLHQLQATLGPIDPLAYNDDGRDYDRNSRDSRESHRDSRGDRDIRETRDTRRDARDNRGNPDSPRDTKGNADHRGHRDTRAATRDTRDAIRTSSERTEKGRILEKDTKTSDRDSVWTNSTRAPFYPFLPRACYARMYAHAHDCAEQHTALRCLSRADR
eukprot:Phypoly_transcript_16367.p1 GENE.Phypoly_transcript_16367~~Phypoly_transcript_16367.p1  ORF type:complete len:223 (+),score=16.39 Phypoly_transcript_16367:93-671(+)